MRRPVSVKPFLSFLSFSILRVFLRERSHQDRLGTTIASAVDPQHPFFLPELFPVRQAASVAILPSALFVSDIRSVQGGCSRSVGAAT